MSNYQVEPANKPQALTTEALKSLRHEQVQGISRRELLRGSLAAGVGLWLLEVTAGTVGFLWPNLAGQVRRPRQDRHVRRRQDRQLAACPSTRASPPTTRPRERS